MTTRTTGRSTADPIHDAFTMAGSPFYWIVRVAGKYSLEMEAVLKPIGMDIPRWRVLLALRENSPSSVTELSEHSVVRLSTMTKIVQRMEADGLVETRPRETDARVTDVYVTDKGRLACDKVRGLGSRVFRRAFENVDASDMSELIRILRQIFDNL